MSKPDTTSTNVSVCQTCVARAPHAHGSTFCTGCGKRVSNDPSERTAYLYWYVVARSYHFSAAWADQVARAAIDMNRTMGRHLTHQVRIGGSFIGRCN